MTLTNESSSPTAREVAAAALVGLPEMTAGRLAHVLDRWPDPLHAVEAVRSGRAVAALEGRGRDEQARLRVAWKAGLDLEGTRTVLAARDTRVLVAGDPDWPLDDDLPGAPSVLLVEGTRPEAVGHRPRVAVVGTRAATPHGLDDAVAIGAALAREGVVVVSGMAIGIDGAAHRGALDAGGAVVGVVATGLDVEYPRRHSLLYRRVREQGAVVSEVAFGTRPTRARFPVRNRIIAGLADAVVVVEATLKGGARITADLALDYGRPVLAVPGSRRNASAAGCNALIAEGAVPLLDPGDVMVALGLTAGARDGWGDDAPRTPPTGDAALVHRALGGEPATADQLASRTGLTPPQVAVAVVALKRHGWVTQERGMVWPR